MRRFGHLALREYLSKQILPEEFDSSSIVCQFSSLGSLDEKWLYGEFLKSFSSGMSENGSQAPELSGDPADELKLVWPTVEQVRTSIEGWAAGSSLPGPAKNVKKAFLKPHWHKFNACYLNRDRAMPHIKSYARCNKGRLAWVLLASHNLSKAAWGTFQKKESQFMVRSYELGVLFMPFLERKHRESPNESFSCTKAEGVECGKGSTEFVGVDGDEMSEGIKFCLPFRLPPEPYTSEDEPWCVDVRISGKDVLGKSWGSRTSMFRRLEDD